MRGCHIQFRDMAASLISLQHIWKKGCLGKVRKYKTDKKVNQKTGPCQAMLSPCKNGSTGILVGKKFLSGLISLPAMQ